MGNRRPDTHPNWDRPCNRASVKRCINISGHFLNALHSRCIRGKSSACGDVLLGRCRKCQVLTQQSGNWCARSGRCQLLPLIAGPPPRTSVASQRSVHINGGSKLLLHNARQMSGNNSLPYTHDCSGSYLLLGILHGFGDHSCQRSLAHTRVPDVNHVLSRWCERWV